MKKVTMETHYNELKEAAKELKINYVGIKKEVLVATINAKIDELNAENEVRETEVTSEPKVRQKGKWYEQENAFPYKAGDIVIINTSYRYPGIHNRIVEVVGPSTKRNAVKGHLINPLNGEKQKTCISLDFVDITLLDEAMNPQIEVQVEEVQMDGVLVS